MKIPYEEFMEIKENVSKLDRVWQAYLKEQPNDWYQFKYQTEIERFLEQDRREDDLLAEASFNRLTKKYKISRKTYLELAHLSETSQQLQEILAHPPFGLKESPKVLFKEATHKKNNL